MGLHLAAAPPRCGVGGRAAAARRPRGLYSALSVWRGTGHVYFEVACVVLVAVTLGRWLEATGKHKTMQALRALEKLLPAQARRWSEGGEVETPLSELKPGDVVRVVVGERIPVDGRVCRGQAAVDQQLITGESALRVVEAGDEVFAGGLNLDGDLLVRLSREPREGTLQRLIDAVCQAAAAKGAWQRLADRISHGFTPAVVVLSLVTFGGQAWRGAFEAGLMSGLSVLVIACPCALGIATPLAIWAALGRASRAGVFFRHGDALTRLAEVQAVAFDKTGTLTTGTMELHALHDDGATERLQIWHAAAVVASASTHPVAVAVRRETAGRSLPLPKDLKSVPGRGMSALVDSLQATVWLGSESWMRLLGQAIPAALQQVLARAQAACRPAACVAWDGNVRGVIELQDELRIGAVEVLHALRETGLSVSILTGDHAVSAELATLVPAELLATRLLPEQKLERLQEYRARWKAVAMVGDGVNDAPALAAADVGVSLGCGADLSRETADICLLGNDLWHLPWAIGLARRTVRAIRQNLFWAFAYNVVGIGLAVTGRLNPLWAAAAMTGSSLFVISNSLRLASHEERQPERGPSRPATAASTARERETSDGRPTRSGS